MENEVRCGLRETKAKENILFGGVVAIIFSFI